MKIVLKVAVGVLASALFLGSALCATLAPIQLLNPTGSTAGQAILSTGPTAAPAWGPVALSGVSGTLAIANGGTGQTSSGAALTALGGAALAGSTTQTFNVANATSANNAVNYSQAFGVGQTFTNETGSRVSGTTYTNSSGRPIIVYVSATSTATAAALFGVVSSISCLYVYQPNSGSGLAGSLVVPSGATYSVTAGSATINNWYELR